MYQNEQQVLIGALYIFTGCVLNRHCYFFFKFSFLLGCHFFLPSLNSEYFLQDLFKFFSTHLAEKVPVKNLNFQNLNHDYRFFTAKSLYLLILTVALFVL